jgi:hypothetical protein
MDPKLKKRLNKSEPAPAPVLPSDDFYKDIARQLLTGTNYLIISPPGAAKNSLAPGIISHVQNQRIWYVAPSVSLSPYRLFLLKSALPRTRISLASESEISDYQVLIWSPDMLAAHLTEIEDMPAPALIIFDDAEFLDHPKTGRLLETCLLCLPKEIPGAILMSSISNPEEVAAWLETCRERPCRVLETGEPEQPNIPVFISSQWDMVPFLDKKRLSNKVKRILKEETPFRDIRNPSFVQNLVALLRKEGLIPAIVITDSEKVCDTAVSSCTRTMRETGDALTHPPIAAMLDRYPFLKDHPMLPQVLSKRVASFHPGHHPLWRRLVEHFLSFGCIDLIFGTPDSAEELVNRFQAAVICPSKERQYQPLKIIQWHADRITGLLGTGNDSRCTALVHTADADPVYIKDLLLNIPHPLSGGFRCDCRTVLAILASVHNDENPDSILNLSYVGTQTPPFGEFCMESFQAELRNELPNALCSCHIQTITALIDTRIKLTMRLNKCLHLLDDAADRKTRERLDEVRWKLEDALAWLPCEECPHVSLCHKRGSRKFRNLQESYCEIRKTLKKNVTGLKLDYHYYLECLREFGLADAANRITADGIRALRTGLKFPQPLMECIRERLIPFDDPDISFALTGGFAEMGENRKPEMGTRKETDAGYLAFVPKPGDRNEEHQLGGYELTRTYIKIEAAVSRVRERMLRFGILLPEYDISLSELLLAWKNGADTDILARQTGFSPGFIAELISKAEYLCDA